MAVDPQWLRQTRMRNREQFGMPGLGAGTAEGIATTLQRVRAARIAQQLSVKERAAGIRAREELAKDPRTAVLLALPAAPELPAIVIPERRPIPKGVMIVGGLLAVGLLALIASSLRRPIPSEGG